MVEVQFDGFYLILALTVLLALLVVFLLPILLILFAVAQLVIFSVLGFFIPSPSGLAILSMPIMAPLADTAGLSRELVINAYNWGQGLMAFITPTGLILVTLEMAGTTFNKWLKYIMPLLAIMGVFSAVMLIIKALL